MKTPEGHLVSPHRSQPVLKVEVTMDFTPREVARDVYECRERVVKGKIAGEVRVCLHVRKNTRDRLREGEAGWVGLKRLNDWGHGRVAQSKVLTGSDSLLQAWVE